MITGSRICRGTMGTASNASCSLGTPASTSFRPVTASAAEKPIWKHMDTSLIHGANNKPNIHGGTVKYFSSEEQGTKGEDCGHLDDGEQQLVGFHDALCLLLLDSPISSAVIVFPFHDGHQRGRNQEHHSPKEQEVCSRNTEKHQLQFCCKTSQNCYLFTCSSLRECGYLTGWQCPCPWALFWGICCRSLQTPEPEKAHSLGSSRRSGPQSCM